MDVDAEYYDVSEYPNDDQGVASPSPSQEAGAEPRQLSPLTIQLRSRPEERSSDGDFLPSGDEQLDSADSDSSDGGFAPPPLKRSADDTNAYRPLKRQKGPPNVDYLALLNEDIRDAAQGMSLGDDDGGGLTASQQLGMVVWSAVEKKAFFEALARLGRDDVEGIATRVGSKSVVEIGHYLDMLEEEHAARLRTDSRPVLTLAEYPAAVELSQQCCHALEEAADAISLRQENREKQREEGIWGTDVWDLTPDVARRLRNDSSLASGLPSLGMFHLPMWLKLSQRFFMNSSVPGSNWAHVDNVPPSIWATTFEDFHSLAVSVTRRLVQTAIFTAETRIRSKREMRPETRSLLRRRDVEAAVASLGMPTNSEDFWRRSARRLRLDVYSHIDDETGEPVLMTYDEVENALSGTGEEPAAAAAAELLPELRKTYEQHGSDVSLSDVDDQENEGDHGTDDDDDEEYDDDEEKYAVDAEMNEVLKYSVADFPSTARLKEGLRSRIVTERERDRLADHYDQYASYRGELDMWKLLQRSPPAEIAKVSEPEPLSRSNNDVENMYPLGRDWRRNTQYRSEWETL
ncbi:hypothetical protein GMORB2_0521 [Geosmithia morbida]|uniref:Homeodomain-like protein n=1 Tax=Geosmithia morbida TaxID=1094350 RepID=A0A9P5D9Q9_9HYPO|nr:uncharacterized protein GMORB2_0521 [Geosmithia morbida]KAF4126784.1 hypothetical protein GMORB2_0521 [Geosmithia morbida]